MIQRDVERINRASAAVLLQLRSRSRHNPFVAPGFPHRRTNFNFKPEDGTR